MVDGDVVNFLQVFFKAFAEAAVGVGKHHQFAFAVAFHLGEGVFQWQAVKRHGRQFVGSLFCQVAFLFGVDEGALNEEITLGIGIKNLVALHPNFKHARHGRFADLFYFGQGRQALGQCFFEVGILRHERAAGQHQYGHGKNKVQTHEGAVQGVTSWGKRWRRHEMPKGIRCAMFCFSWPVRPSMS